jgi:hypothetical protein
MGQPQTPDGMAGHRDPMAAHRPPRAAPLVAGSVLCVVAPVFLTGGGWALWKDRVDRDGEGFVSFGNTELGPGQYAIVGDVRGDGPSWLYGSTLVSYAPSRTYRSPGSEHDKSQKSAWGGVPVDARS